MVESRSYRIVSQAEGIENRKRHRAQRYKAISEELRHYLEDVQQEQSKEVSLANNLDSACYFLDRAIRDTE